MKQQSKLSQNQEHLAETQAQAQAQTDNFLNYGPGYQAGSAQMFH